jgi:hypothetical protein
LLTVPVLLAQAEKEAIGSKQHDVEEVANPILARAYQGGAPTSGGAPPDAPTVEEVD